MSPLAAGRSAMRLYEGGPAASGDNAIETIIGQQNETESISAKNAPPPSSQACEAARTNSVNCMRDGSLRGPAAMAHCAVLPRWSLRGPAAMVVARSCRDGRCAVLPRCSLRGPAAMVAARSCRDGSLRGPAAMAHCAVLPRWSLRGPAAMCFPNMEAAPPPLRRVPPCAV